MSLQYRALNNNASFFYAAISATLFGRTLRVICLGVNIDSSLPTENDGKLLAIILQGNNKFNTKTNLNVLICTWKVIKDSYRFHNSLF